MVTEWRRERVHESCWQRTFTLLVAESALELAQSGKATKATPHLCADTLATNVHGNVTCPHSNEAYVPSQLFSASEGMGRATYIHMCAIVRNSALLCA